MSERPGEKDSADVIQMYRATIQPLYRFVSRRAGGSRQLAEDVTQETYLRAVAHWQNRHRPDNALAWLQTVARNLLLNHYRRRSPESLNVASVASLSESEPANSPDAAALVYWGLARLGRSRARLLEAFYIEGQSTRTIAGDLGLSERAVEGRLRRARQALKNLLTPIMQSRGDMS